MSSTIITMENGADLSSGRYYIMKLSTGKLVKASSNTDTLVGILNENAPDSATSGNQLALCVMGEAYVIAGAGFPAGAFLKADADGKAQETAAAADVLLGQALEKADSAGDVVRVLVNIGPNR
tara:strand:+ start:20771 stop:21139 length:369 start_codon:yes stop_codon:yes gene_type:complete